MHLWDTVAGRETYQHLFSHELLTVIFPALLGIWIAWPRRILGGEDASTTARRFPRAALTVFPGVRTPASPA
jgi:hypothetical protein